MRAGIALFVAVLAGCSRPLAQPPYIQQPSTALVEVTEPPPPGRVEIIPRRPDKTAVWVDGEWMWRRRKWAWVPGRWVDAPPGARLAPWAFVRGLDGRLWMAASAWYDAKGTELPWPPPLSTAQVTSSDVINATGDIATTGPNVERKP